MGIKCAAVVSVCFFRVNVHVYMLYLFSLFTLFFSVVFLYHRTCTLIIYIIVQRSKILLAHSVAIENMRLEAVRTNKGAVLYFIAPTDRNVVPPSPKGAGWAIPLSYRVARYDYAKRVMTAQKQSDDCAKQRLGQCDDDILPNHFAQSVAIRQK